MEAIAKFVDLLREVVEDGELTFQEIYQIGKWINDNKSVRAEWPVNDFYKLLKGALADGKVEVSEAWEVGVPPLLGQREPSRQITKRKNPAFCWVLMV
jgi:hypothetical protein